MIIHDFIYIIYIFFYILASKYYLNNNKRVKPRDENNVNESFELTDLQISNKNDGKINLKQSANNENELEMALEKENSWLKWIKIINLRFFIKLISIIYLK